MHWIDRAPIRKALSSEFSLCHRSDHVTSLYENLERCILWLHLVPFIDISQEKFLIVAKIKACKNYESFGLRSLEANKTRATLFGHGPLSGKVSLSFSLGLVWSFQGETKGTVVITLLRP